MTRRLDVDATMATSDTDLTGAVLAWGGPRLRDLPWRRTRDPWAVLVSEVMLQQTQVARVVPKWQAFMAAFPTPGVCAEASLADVLRLWHGLGYPRRARNLHAAAQVLSSGAAGGAFPSTLDGLRALPGVGAYTARAVMAFAFEADVAVVDTNIARVLARVAGGPLRPKAAQAAADALVPSGDGWVWNQALMDLGAVLCRPSSPGCSVCPIHAACSFRGLGPDPAIGSAGVSRRQARFDGSDRQARGRLLGALIEAALVEIGEAATVMRRSPEEVDALIDGLVADGLVVRRGDVVHLPDAQLALRTDPGEPPAAGPERGSDAAGGGPSTA